MADATITGLSERVAHALSSAEALDAAMGSLREVLLARPGDDRGGVGAGLADLAREVAEFDREVREDFERLEGEVDAAVTTLQALRDRAAQRRHESSEGAAELGAGLDRLRQRLEEVETRLAASAAETAQTSHEVARSAEEGRGALRHHVEALHRAAGETGDHAAETAGRTRRHSAEVGEALEQELGSAGRLVGAALERLQHEMEDAVTEQVRGAVREGVERLRALLRELLDGMGDDRDDLRGVRELLTSLFDRLQSLLSPLEAEAGEVQEVHLVLQERRRQREEHDDDG